MPIAINPILPLLILPLGILLLQWHGVPYWQARLGWWPGLSASILVELLSLWRWYQPAGPGLFRWFRPMAWTATALLLWGPLNQVAADAVLEWQRLAVNGQGAAVAMEVEDAEIRQALASVAHLQGLLAAGRFGWRDDLRTAQATLTASRGRKRALLETLSTVESQRKGNWQRLETIAATALLILLAQAGTILAITTLSTTFHRTENIGKPVESPAAPLPLGQVVSEAQQAVRRRRDAGETDAQIAEAIGADPRYISLLMNHQANAASGKRVLGERTLRGLWGRLGNTSK